MKPSWEDLNAYVDGELDPERQAQVAAEVADDSDLAREVAALTRLKAALAQGVGDPPPIPALTPPRLPRRWMAAAAAAIVVAVGAAAVAVSFRPEPQQPGLLAQAVADHRQWLAVERAGEPPAIDPQAVAAMHDIGARPYIPDLGGASLVLLGQRFLATGGGPRRLQVLYGGERGCRLTLWVALTGSTAPEAMAGELVGDFGTWSWSEAGNRYILVSAIEASRLRVIAETVERLTREYRPADPGLVVAMVDARNTSPPCAA